MDNQQGNITCPICYINSGGTVQRFESFREFVHHLNRAHLTDPNIPLALSTVTSGLPSTPAVLQCQDCMALCISHQGLSLHISRAHPRDHTGTGEYHLVHFDENAVADADAMQNLQATQQPFAPHPLQVQGSPAPMAGPNQEDPTQDLQFMPLATHQNDQFRPSDPQAPGMPLGYPCQICFGHTPDQMVYTLLSKNLECALCEKRFCTRVAMISEFFGHTSIEVLEDAYQHVLNRLSFDRASGLPPKFGDFDEGRATGIPEHAVHQAPPRTLQDENEEDARLLASLRHAS